MNSTQALFYTSLYTFLGGFLLAIVSFLYKSKCKSIDCLGCHIERDIETEAAADLAQIRGQSIDNPTRNSS